jgi:hypothetical protein
MWNSTLVPRRYLSKVYFAGVKDMEVARRLGFEAFATVEEAIQAAEAELGKTASITLLQRPPMFIPRVSE